jgi:hypothetical protein
MKNIKKFDSFNESILDLFEKDGPDEEIGRELLKSMQSLTKDDIKVDMNDMPVGSFKNYRNITTTFHANNIKATVIISTERVLNLNSPLTGKGKVNTSYIIRYPNKINSIFRNRQRKW